MLISKLSKILRVATSCCLVLLANNSFATVQLDTSFGSDGKVTTAIGSSTDKAYSVMQQADKKLVVAGHSDNGNGFDFVLVRYNKNGSLDETFDSDGIYRLSSETNERLSYDGMAYANGDVYLAGEVDGEFLLAKISVNDAPIISGTPGNDEVGSYDNIVIRVSDGGLTDALPAFSIEVTNVNDAGSVSITGIATQGETLTARVDDADGATGSIVYQWKRGTTNVGYSASYPLVQADVGKTLTVTASYTDRFGTAETVTSAATTSIVNVNDAPTFTSTAVTAATQDVAYSYTATASDPDGDPLTLSAPTLPSWLSFTAGTLSGTPTNAKVGDHAVTLRVSDGTVDVEQSFTITVANIRASGELNLEFANYEIAENGYSLTVTVVRSDGDYGTLSVVYALQDGTATATLDYQFQSGTLTFLDGVIRQTIEIIIVDDNDYEGDEDFIITLLSNLVDEGSLGETSSATITIKEDDPTPPAGAIGFEFNTELVKENDASVSLSVVRTGGSFGEVSVSYNTAVAGNDYVAASGELTFSDGETAAKTIIIELIDDAVYESVENFTVNLSSPKGGATLGTATSRVTILDDQPPPPAGVLEFENATASVTENGRSISVKVVRVDGDFGAVNVDVLSANKTATASEDYDAIAQTLTFTNGKISQTVTIDINDDSDYEGDETFALQLRNVVGAALGDQSTATVTIMEDDPVPPAGVLQFSGASYSVDEDALSVLLTITRTHGSYGEISVEVATGDGDGATSQTVTIYINDDTDYEGDESFTVTLANVTGGASIGTPSSAMVTIVEDEPTPAAGNLQWSGDSYRVNEADGRVTFTVLRTEGSGEVSVGYVVRDSAINGAINGEDYTAADGTLYFADGVISQTIAIEIIDDAIDETTETFPWSSPIRWVPPWAGYKVPRYRLKMMINRSQI